MPRIYIDIETIPSGERPDISTLVPPGTYKKADSIAAWYADTEARNEDIDKIYRKRALSLTECQVICIAFAIDDKPVEGIMEETEEATFKAFEAALEAHDSAIFQRTPQWIGHNLKSFDFPVIALRARKHKCQGVAALTHLPNPYEFLEDTMQMFGFTSRGFMIKLDEACRFFGIPGKNDMDGSMVYDEYLAGNGPAILQYCMDDVEATRQLYKALTYGGILTI